MVLFYGLLALETANNIVSARTSQRRETILNKFPSSSMSSSSNSWIYTEDLKKRYTNYHYIFVPIYIDGKNSRYNYNSTLLIPQKSVNDNSWMYSKSLHNHLFNSTTTKISSSTSSITNQRFIQDEKIRKKHFCQPSSSSKNTIFTVEEEEEDDDENTENDNHSISLIKHHSMISSHSTTESSNDNSDVVNPNQLTNIKSNVKQTNTLTRLRSFFFKSSSSLSATQQ